MLKCCPLWICKVKQNKCEDKIHVEDNKENIEIKNKGNININFGSDIQTSIDEHNQKTKKFKVR